jgi:hypothetical protein
MARLLLDRESIDCDERRLRGSLRFAHCAISQPSRPSITVPPDRTLFQALIASRWIDEVQNRDYRRARR